MALYAASSDGTIAVFQFDPEELEGIAPHSVQEQYLSKFGFTPPPIPEGYSHVPKGDATSSHSYSQAQLQSQSLVTGFGHQANGSGGGEVVNMLVAKRNNKKHGNQTQHGNVPSASNAAGPSRMNGGPPVSKRASLAAIVEPQTSYDPPYQSQSYFPPPEDQPYGDVEMVSIDAIDTPFSPARGKRKASAIDLTDDSRPVTYRTLGGDRQRENIPVRELGGPSVTGGAVKGWGSSGASASLSAPGASLLPIPPLLTRVTSPMEDSDDILEATNPEDNSESLLYLFTHESTNWSQVRRRSSISAGIKPYGLIICLHRCYPSKQQEASAL